MGIFRFNECLIIRDGMSVRVRCPASPKSRLTIRVGEKELGGAFGEGASLYAMVGGDKGEPGPNPYEDNKSDRNYSTFMEFIFLDGCRLSPETVGEKPWLVVETLGRIQPFGTFDALPKDVTADSLGLADWVQVMEDEETDPNPHTPTQRPSDRA